MGGAGRPLNGRHGEPEKVKQLQEDKKIFLNAATIDCGVGEIEAQKVIIKEEVIDVFLDIILQPCGICRTPKPKIPTPELCDMRRGEEGRFTMAKPCTVTAPAEAAGHRMPVWATKIEGFPFWFR
jgi:hypothetical protein